MEKVEIKGNWLYCGDSLQIINDLQNIDAIITDPPYEISNSGGGMLNQKGRDFIKQIDSMGMCESGFFIAGFLTQIVSIFSRKENFSGVFFCSLKQLKDYINWAEVNGLQYGVGVWHKPDPAPLCNNKYLNDLEYWVYIKGNKSKILGDYSTKSMSYTAGVNKKDKQLFKHPTIKPVNLMEKFVINHVIDGGVVLDPFMGSGTTGVAAVKQGKKFIGIEKDKRYFDIACERIEKAYDQADLFSATTLKPEQENIFD